MQSIAATPILQRWNVIQHEVIPALGAEVGTLTPRLERLVHILEWVRIEEFTAPSSLGIGRPRLERAWLANAFIAKSMLALTSTTALIERLTIDRVLRRICGFPLYRRLPSESTFSRAFAEFSSSCLAERVHEALVTSSLGDRLVGHLSRDGTAIPVRERPKALAPDAIRSVADGGQVSWLPGDASPSRPSCKSNSGKPRSRRRRRRSANGGEGASASPIRRQRGQSLAAMLGEIPSRCDRGAKSNAQGYKMSWNGYKLHLDTADCGVPVSALLSSASMHDSRAAIPLSLMSQARVTSLYDLMDAAYCSVELHAHCRSLNHVPLIDHNPRGGAKEYFEAADAVRYRERSVAERSNGRLKDEFGGRHIMVRGPRKVKSHLMFGVLALSADQLLRLRI